MFASHDDGALRHGPVRNGFYRVHEQVQYHLLKLDAVAPYVRRLRARSSWSGTLRMIVSLIISITTSRITSFVSVTDRVAGAFDHQVAHAPDDFACAAIVVDDVEQDLAHLGHVGPVIEDPAGCLSIAKMPVSGWLSWCASDAVSSPMVDTRVKCARSWRAFCASSSARLRGVTST